MKLRNGFVSNSSSSCFVIAYNPDSNPCKDLHKHRAYIVTGIKEIFDMYKSKYHIEDDDWFDDAEWYQREFNTFAAKIAKFATAVNNGKEIAYVRIADDDVEDSYNILRNTNKVEILEDFVE